MKVKFKKYNCVTKLAKYSNGRTAIELVSEKRGEPILMATVNIPQVSLEKDEVILKEYSEGTGILKSLMDAGVVSAPLRFVESGYITAPVCKLLI